MQLSLSCRIAEGFLSKTEANLPFEQVCDLAVAAECGAVCMRPSQLTIHSSEQEISAALVILRAHRLRVSMISGDADIVYNNDQGPRCLAKITPHLDLAEALGAPMIRVCIKTSGDLREAQRAADEAADREITLVQQCHIQSPFETVDQIESCLRQINRSNFGLIYEAANLEQCRQSYGPATIVRLAPLIRNVYVQNQRIDVAGAVTLDSWTQGPISIDLIEIPEAGGIDFPMLFAGLQQVGYDGVVTVHQSAPTRLGDPSEIVESVRQTCAYIRSIS